MASATSSLASRNGISGLQFGLIQCHDTKNIDIRFSCFTIVTATDFQDQHTSQKSLHRSLWRGDCSRDIHCSCNTKAQIDCYQLDQKQESNRSVTRRQACAAPVTLTGPTFCMQAQFTVVLLHTRQYSPLCAILCTKEGTNSQLCFYIRDNIVHSVQFSVLRKELICPLTNRTVHCLLGMINHS